MNYFLLCMTSILLLLSGGPLPASWFPISTQLTIQREPLAEPCVCVYLYFSPVCTFLPPIQDFASRSCHLCLLETSPLSPCSGGPLWPETVCCLQQRAGKTPGLTLFVSCSVCCSVSKSCYSTLI